jgi:galactitol-specific phosphotransferase system IIC component
MKKNKTLKVITLCVALSLILIGAVATAKTALAGDVTSATEATIEADGVSIPDAAAIETGDVSAVVDVIKDYLPLLAVLLFLIGQALKKIPDFKTWTLPFIMGGIGLAFGLALAVLGGYDPIRFMLAIVEGVVAGLASTGINEAKVQGTEAATIQTPDDAHDTSDGGGANG